ncbi:MAG: reverse transcriptase family protein [Phycisphaerae bacterium]
MEQPGEASETLRIRRISHLATQLGISTDHLVTVAEQTRSYYREFDKVVKGKLRHLLMALEPLASLQRKILDRILCRLSVSEHAFGAIKGRGIRDNAAEHAKAQYIAKLDIKDFYPSIRHEKVYGFFVGQECSPDVSRILTQLTTWRYALPLGTATSPFLADQIVHAVDGRIAGIARKHGLKYTRYVDDITISGDFELERIADLIIRIVSQAGFRVKRSKLEIYRPGDAKERIVTGVRVDGGKLSVPRAYVDELRDDLVEALKQSLRSSPTGEFMTRQHYLGRIGYVLWLDPPTGKDLLRIYRKVRWRHLEWAGACPGRSSTSPSALPKGTPSPANERKH